MNFLSDNMVYRRGQDYLRRRRSRTRNVKDEQQEALAGGDNKLDASSTPPTAGQHSHRKTGIPTPLEGGESADDEGESSMPIQDEDVVAWKHTDRALNARLSRQEQLEREKEVIEDALRSSLSTLMMLQPGSSASTPAKQQEYAHSVPRSPPSLSTSPSSTLTLRGARPRDAAPRSASTAQSFTPAAGRASSQSMYSTTSGSQRPAQLMERRRTYTNTTASASRGGSVARAIRRGEEPDWTDASAHISSASSFEDLGKQRKAQEGSDLDMDFSSSTGEEEAGGGTSPNLASPALSSRSAGISSSPRRRRRPKRGRMDSLRRTAVTGRASQDGVQSDPEGRGSSERTADDSFLELLEATKTFMAMNPRYSSTANSSAIDGASLRTAKSMPAQLLWQDSTPRGRTLALPEEGDLDLESERAEEHSPAPPVSMSASTNFDLSSSDSPPSHGLTSSRGGDDASKDEYDNDQHTPPPQPIVSDPRLSSDASREVATPREVGELEKPAPRRPSPSWLEWLHRQVRRVTVGIGLVGIGLVLAVGVGLFKTTTIRRNPSRFAFPMQITLP